MGMQIDNPDPEEVANLAASLGLELDEGMAIMSLPDMRTQETVNKTCAKCLSIDGCESILGRGTTSRLRIHNGSARLELSKCQKRIASEKNKKLSELIAASDVPEKLREMSFKGFEVGENRAAVEAVRKMVRDTKGNGLVLTGPPGVGKTHLGMALVNNRLIMGNAALYVTAPQLFKSIVSSYESGKYNSLMENLITVDLLMLDDLGVEKTTDNRQEELFMIINSRVNAGRQMIITTNLSAADIRDRYGARILSRLMASCDWHEVNGTDRRLAGREV
jgi:DNA replication protein DnaC